MSYAQPQATTGDTQPQWYREYPPEDGCPRAAHSFYDVAVIGAGISGLSVAYHCLRAGRRVIVLDKGPIGGGETGRTSAHLSNALDDRFHVLEKVHGAAGARLAAESHRAGLEDIFAICEREQIVCDAARVDGYLFSRPGNQREQREIEREQRAAERAGLRVDLLESAPLPFETGVTLRFRDQAQIQPMAYLSGLAHAVRGLGGEICTGARVRGVESGDPAAVRMDGGFVQARSVVVATNTPIIDLFAIHSKQAAYRSYAIAARVAQGSIHRALYWDLGDPYHYVRLTADDLLLVGGEDHKVGQEAQPEKRWERLIEWTQRHFPTVGEIQSHWSGQVLEPADGLAFIGRNPGTDRNIYIVTGDSGNGMTHGALAGLLVTDLILGRDSPWSALYDPARKMTHPLAIKEYMRDNANATLHYADWITPAPIPVLQPGSGSVVRRGGHRIAVYISDHGVGSACSARCPHLGGVVQWNGAERSWDCPLHGSRFDARGRMLMGPARDDLTRVDHEEQPHPTPSLSLHEE